MPSTAKAFIKKQSRAIKSSHNFYSVDWNYIQVTKQRKTQREKFKKRGGGAREG